MYSKPTATTRYKLQSPTDNPSRGNQGKPPTDNSMVAQTDSYGGNPSREAMRRKGGDN
jgi:hypothetical protein